MVPYKTSKTSHRTVPIANIVCSLALTWLAVGSKLIPGCEAANAKPVDSAQPLNSGWSYRRDIFLENKGDLVENAVVPIELNAQFDYAKAKAGGADIRFSTDSKHVKGAGLPYWIEQWNDGGTSKIWVKLPVFKPHNRQKIYLYYGNASAAPASNGNDTFLFFDDFEGSDFAQKWTNVSIGQVAEQGGLLKLKEDDGQDGIITANFDVTGPMVIRTRYQREGGDEHWTRAGVGGWNNWFCFGDHTDWAGRGTNYVMFYDSTSLNDLKTAPLVKVANKVITDKWCQIAYSYDGSQLSGVQDGGTVQWPTANASSKLALRTLDNDSWDNFAFINVSPYLKSEPKVTIGKEKAIQ